MKLHLVDGTFELFRAHFAKRPPHVGPDGRDLKATIGIAQSLMGLIKYENVTHLAIAFDNPIVSFRNKLFSGYKSDEGMDPALRSQFDSAEEAARAVGVTVWSMDEFEADDALATGAARFKDQVDQVRILTPDKDLGQCLDGGRVVQVDVIRKREIDEAALYERRGIVPASIPDYLALCGDDADGIPGLPGFGERTASLLLAKFIHLDRIPLDKAEWPPEVRGADRLLAVLRDEMENALLYRTLATLRRDVPLKETLEDLRYRGVPEERMAAFRAATGWTRS
ncbi:MAG TPA: 5'-3' exonuclease H3TH domain-containing protein [Myxococcales bacterium]|jgi:5'-3' exonuclease|nr:5'-3' exonuclease H3TH domain-containing protein [Myxococcales bacterium]